MNFIRNSFVKILESKTNDKQKEILNKFIEKMMNFYILRKNNLKCYYEINKELTRYDDLILINLNNISEINQVLENIKYSNMIYKKNTLPNKYIMEKNINTNI